MIPCSYGTTPPERYGPWPPLPANYVKQCEDFCATQIAALSSGTPKSLPYAPLSKETIKELGLHRDIF